MKRIKFIIALIILAGAGVAMVNDSLAFPPFLPKSKKFGAKDCTFCHVNAEGGEPHNERGQWLIKEKDRRKRRSPSAPIRTAFRGHGSVKVSVA